MSDMDLNTRNKNFSQNQNTGTSQNLKDQVADAGAEIKQRAGDALRSSTDTAREKFREAADAAKDVAAGAADRFQDQTREQQRTGADFVGKLAGNIREAARAFENDVPFAARGINSAAEYVDEAAEKIRNGSLRDLVDGATDFAKRQPAAFLGLSVLAGFAAVRFLKASGSQNSSGQASSRQGSSSSDAPSSYSPSSYNPSSYSSGSYKGEASRPPRPICGRSRTFSAMRCRNSQNCSRTRLILPRPNSVRRFSKSVAPSASLRPVPSWSFPRLSWRCLRFPRP